MSPHNATIETAGSRSVQSSVSNASASRTVHADETDEHAEAFPGFALDVVRTGLGFGPNITRASVQDAVTVVSSVIQFPVLGRARVPDDAFVVTLITNAPRNTRWCGIDLATNDLLLYGPGTEHTAVSPAGLSFSLASITIADVENVAEQRGIAFHRPARGQVVGLGGRPEAEPLERLLRPTSDTGERLGVMPRSDLFVHAAGTLLSNAPRPGGSADGTAGDSRSIVNTCIEYVDTVCGSSGSSDPIRTPSIAELRTAAHVSERRLRNAFYDTFEIGPMRFFRLRLMTSARIQLLGARETGATVSDIAAGLGYAHFGRFASYYAETFGERPSATASLG